MRQTQTNETSSNGNLGWSGRIVPRAVSALYNFDLCSISLLFVEHFV